MPRATILNCIIVIIIYKKLENVRRVTFLTRSLSCHLFIYLLFIYLYFLSNSISSVEGKDGG
jgi:hypothetical protein